MAIYHNSLKTSKDHKKLVHDYYEYICRIGRYSEGEKAEELIYTANHNMPGWAEENPYEFWKASFDFERANGNTFKELEIALPKELSREEQIKLSEEYCRELFGNEFVYTLAVHSNGARLSKNIGELLPGSDNLAGEENPHMHIMFCERQLDGIKRDKVKFFKRANSRNPERGGTKKDERWNGTYRRHHLIKVREKWAEIQNKYLKEKGLSQRVDHRTLKAQRKEALAKGDLEKAKELDRPPGRKLGAKLVSLVKVLNNNPDSINIKLDDNNQEKRDKIAYAITIREYLDLLAAMQNHLNKMKEHQSKPQAWERKEINKSVAEFRALCGKLIAEHLKASKALLEKYQQLKKEEITDKKALLMALSSYYKGGDKKIIEAIQKRREEEAELNKEIAVFNKKPKPAFFDFKKKEEYQKEYTTLMAKKAELAERKKYDDQKYLELKQDMNRPEVKNQIYEMKAEILKESRQKAETAESLYQDYKELKKDLKTLYELKKTFEFVKGETQIIIPENKQSLKPVDLLKSVAADLTRTQNQGLQVRINTYENEI